MWHQNIQALDQTVVILYFHMSLGATAGANRVECGMQGIAKSGIFGYRQCWVLCEPLQEVA